IGSQSIAEALLQMMKYKDIEAAYRQIPYKLINFAGKWADEDDALRHRTCLRIIITEQLLIVSKPLLWAPKRSNRSALYSFFYFFCLHSGHTPPNTTWA